MSRIESRIVTIKCNRFGCDKEKIEVGNTPPVTDDGWTQGEFDENFDLCPEHDEELRDFFYGEETRSDFPTAHKAEDMEIDV